jgi:preprotein translocase subunit SecF
LGSEGGFNRSLMVVARVFLLFLLFQNGGENDENLALTLVRGLEFGNMPSAYMAFDNFLSLLTQAPSAEQEQLRMAFIDDIFSNIG